jgi:signal transduction histidine kinase
MDRIQRAIAEKSFQKIERVVDPSRDQEAYFDITIYPIFTAFYEGVVIRVDDITERVRIEKLMIHSEKMLSVGGLAAGMAHEINNPLAGILQNIQVIGNRFDLNFAKNRETAQKYGLDANHLNGYFRERGIADLIKTVQASGRRAARIVENMLSFSRKGTSRFERCDLAELLDKIVDLASNDYDIKRNYDFRRYEVIREYETDLPKVACEGDQIQQVVLNLLKNGVQAMDRGGGRFTLRLLREDHYVRLEVEDNGPGMEEAIRKRVFEPFFTTKEVGVGTGLGLSVSYFIITETHGGLIDVESSPGKGAKFIIKLPLDHAH